MIVCDVIRQRVKVLERQQQVIGESAVASIDAERGAVRAMGRPIRAARVAHAARRVDLTRHAPPDQICAPIGLFDDADELVTGHTGE